MTTDITFSRSNSYGDKKVVVLTVNHLKALSAHELVACIKTAVSTWVSETREGEEMYDGVSGQITVEDLADIDQSLLKPFLGNQGLLGFHVTKHTDDIFDAEDDFASQSS